jgi:hypothetical protein
MRNLFEAFVRQRRYEKGVSSRTEGWYWQAWRMPLQVADGKYLHVFLGEICEIKKRSDRDGHAARPSTRE